MGEFEVISGNFIEIANKMPTEGASSYNREGYGVLVMSQDPSVMSCAEVAERLHYRNGFIKYQDKIFYFNTMDQYRKLCDVYVGPNPDDSPSHSQYALTDTKLRYYDAMKSTWEDISSDKDALTKLRAAYSTPIRNASDEQLKEITDVTGHAHVRKPLLLYPIDKPEKSNFLMGLFTGLRTDEARVFVEDSDILSFNLLRHHFKMIKPMLVTSGRQDEVKRDINREFYFSSTMTTSAMKSALQASKVYNCFAQGLFTARTFPGNYIAFLMTSGSHLEQTPQGNVGVCYQDSTGVFCGVSIAYIRDDSNKEIPIEQRPKIYSICIIKNVMDEDPLQRKVTFITYRDGILDIPQDKLVGSGVLTRDEVLARMETEIGEEKVYQLFSSPIRNHDVSFMSSFNSLKKTVLNRQRLEELLTTLQERLPADAKEVIDGLKQGMDREDYFTFDNLRTILLFIDNKYSNTLGSNDNKYRFQREMVIYFLTLKKDSATGAEHDRCEQALKALREDGPSLLQRTLFAIAQAEWAFDKKSRIDRKEVVANALGKESSSEAKLLETTVALQEFYLASEEDSPERAFCSQALDDCFLLADHQGDQLFSEAVFATVAADLSVLMSGSDDNISAASSRRAAMRQEQQAFLNRQRLGVLLTTLQERLPANARGMIERWKSGVAREDQYTLDNIRALLFLIDDKYSDTLSGDDKYRFQREMVIYFLNFKKESLTGWELRRCEQALEALQKDSPSLLQQTVLVAAQAEWAFGKKRPIDGKEVVANALGKTSSSEARLLETTAALQEFYLASDEGSPERAFCSQALDDSFLLAAHPGNESFAKVVFAAVAADLSVLTAGSTEASTAASSCRAAVMQQQQDFLMRASNRRGFNVLSRTLEAHLLDSARMVIDELRPGMDHDDYYTFDNIRKILLFINNEYSNALGSEENKYSFQREMVIYFLKLKRGSSTGVELRRCEEALNVLKEDAPSLLQQTVFAVAQAEWAFDKESPIDRKEVEGVLANRSSSVDKLLQTTAALQAFYLASDEGSPERAFSSQALDDCFLLAAHPGNESFADAMFTAAEADLSVLTANSADKMGAGVFASSCRVAVMQQQQAFLTSDSEKLANMKAIVTRQMRIFDEKRQLFEKKLPQESLYRVIPENAQALHGQLGRLIKQSDGWALSDWEQLSSMLTHCSRALDNPHDSKNFNNISTAAQGLAKKADPKLKITGWALLGFTASLLVATVATIFTAGLAIPVALGVGALVCAWLGRATLVKQQQFSDSAAHYASSLWPVAPKPASSVDKKEDGVNEGIKPR